MHHHLRARPRYLHATLVVPPGGQAKHANLLEGKVQEGTARRAALPEPLRLEGSVVGV